MASELHTLTEVSRRTGISMPTLLRYKKRYQKRIPSVGKGRKQRYPQEALAVFAQIKQENLAKRGRRAAATKRTAKKGVAKKRSSTKRAGSAELLTLTEISRRTGISYPTLARYLKLHGRRVPSTGKGRKRRFPEEAQAVFEALRKASRPGRKKAPVKRAAKKRTAARRKISKPSPRSSDVSNAALSERLAKVETTLEHITMQLQQLISDVKRPIRVTIGG